MPQIGTHPALVGLKGYRRIFSRFEKLDLMFVGFISFALIAAVSAPRRGAPPHRPIHLMRLCWYGESPEAASQERTSP